MRKKKEQAVREHTLASGWKVEGEIPAAAVEEIHPFGGGSEEKVPDAAENALPEVSGGLAGDPGTPALSNGSLVLLGVFGGLHLIYTWGWFIVAQAYSSVNSAVAAGSGVIGGVLQQMVFWAAPLAPLLWFFVSILFSRGGHTKRLAVLLTVGAVVLLPVPMLIARGG